MKSWKIFQAWERGACYKFKPISHSHPDRILLASFRLRSLLGNLAVAGIYWLLAKSDLFFAAHHGPVVLWWPADGYALAVLLLKGLCVVPGIFVGAFASSVDVFGSPLIALSIGLGQTLEIVVGWWLLSQKMQFDVAMIR
ncbi:MASE1 domain-containing protein, partial [Methylomarinum vadi]|uniref:MASE1 domain-containing protein n=1 Tax=Methylomarinum vadi TaxID=438855 RepID=UPI001F3B46C9